MESLEPTSAKFKLWRWLLLLSVITVALGGFVWWKSPSERQHLVEPIWSDSLAGHENDSAATGQRRKFGEVWSVTRSGGFTFFGRGTSRDFEGRYPVFTSANPFQQAVTDKWLTEMRDAALIQTEFNWTKWWGWSRWWDSVVSPSLDEHESICVSCEVLFVSDRAISLRQRVSRYEGGSHNTPGSNLFNFVDRNDQFHEVQLDELFHSAGWPEVIADFSRSDLRRQGTEFKGGVGERVDGTPKVRSFTHLISKNHFTMTPDGLCCYFHTWMLDPDPGVEIEVLIPWKTLAVHLRPDGPHRLFQTKVGD